VKYNIYFLFIIFNIHFLTCFGEIVNLYTPTTINSPLFKIGEINEYQVGAMINNYGMYYNYSQEFNRRIVIFSIQQNNGNFKFDPLHFNDYYQQGEETNLIQSKPDKLFYCELGLGYNFKLKKQILNLIAGGGHQFQNNNSRYFLQFDWGNESKKVNAGISLRGNYTMVNNTNLITLEPAIQCKIKISKLRIINQFGYSIAIKKGEDYMKPVLTIGLEFIH
jgi:hypothetical protein